MRNAFSLSLLGRSAAVAFGIAGIAFSASASPMFQGLGDLPGGSFDSRAFGVSADGSVVVGQSASHSGVIEAEAFRWTVAGGMVGIGAAPGGGSSQGPRYLR